MLAAVEQFLRDTEAPAPTPSAPATSAWARAARLEAVRATPPRHPWAH
jgi:hypothetical protein